MESFERSQDTLPAESLLGLPEQHGFDRSWVAGLRKAYDVFRRPGEVIYGDTDAASEYQFRLDDGSTLLFSPSKATITYTGEGATIRIKRPAQLQATTSRDGLDIISGDEKKHDSLVVTSVGLAQVQTNSSGVLKEAQSEYARDGVGKGRIAISLASDGSEQNSDEKPLSGRIRTWDDVYFAITSSESPTILNLGDEPMVTQSPSESTISIDPVNQTVVYVSEYITVALEGIQKVLTNSNKSAIFFQGEDEYGNEKAVS